MWSANRFSLSSCGYAFDKDGRQRWTPHIICKLTLICTAPTATISLCNFAACQLGCIIDVNTSGVEGSCSLFINPSTHHRDESAAYGRVGSQLSPLL